jgi:hypothetical protein
MGNELERQLLREIGGLADLIRSARAVGAENKSQITALEAEATGKWRELRLLRAGRVIPTRTTARRAGRDL